MLFARWLWSRLSLSVDPLWKRLSIKEQPGIVRSGIKELRNALNLAKDEAGHRQRANADTVIALLQPHDRAFGHADALGEPLYGDTPLQARRLDVLTQSFKRAPCVQ